MPTPRHTSVGFSKVDIGDHSNQHSRKYRSLASEHRTKVLMKATAAREPGDQQPFGLPLHLVPGDLVLAWSPGPIVDIMLVISSLHPPSDTRKPRTELVVRFAELLPNDYGEQTQHWRGVFQPNPEAFKTSECLPLARSGVRVGP